MHINYETSCCALNELGDIGQERTPEKILLCLCRDILGYDDYLDNPSNRQTLSLSAFYIFTGVVEFKSGRDSIGDGTTYAPDLATYIKKHKLGTVVQGPARVNRLNHPDHLVRVYIWAPSQKGMEAWYAKNRQQ